MFELKVMIGEWYCEWHLFDAVFICVFKVSPSNHEVGGRLVWFVGYFQNTSLNDASFNFVQFLQEIASEQQFEVTYVDIEEKSMTGISAGVTSWGLLV